MKVTGQSAITPRFGTNFKIISAADELRGKSREDIGEDTWRNPGREALRARNIAGELTGELTRLYDEVRRASKNNNGEYDFTVVDNEPFYPTVLLGSDSYLYHALGRLRRAIEEKKFSFGVLLNLTDIERDRVINALADAREALAEQRGNSRLDIVV